MDVLYPVGGRSPWGREELRYSIRSVCENIEHDRVIVSGEAPAWFTGTHVPGDTDAGKKVRNILGKILRGLEAAGPCVLVLCDDVLLLRSPDLRWGYKGRLSDAVASMRRRRSPNDGFLRSSVATLDLLRSKGIPEPMDFSTHRPWLVERDAAIATVRYCLSLREPVDWQAVHWAAHGGEVARLPQAKDKAWKGPPHAEDDVYSSGDAGERSEGFRAWCRGRWPEPCRWERPD